MSALTSGCGLGGSAFWQDIRNAGSTLTSLLAAESSCSLDTMGTVGGDSRSSQVGSAESGSILLLPLLVAGLSPMYASAMSRSISSSLCPAHAGSCPQADEMLQNGSQLSITASAKCRHLL